MKTFVKRISALLMAVMLTVAVLPTAVQAAPYVPKSVTVYRPSKSGTGSVYFSVNSLGSKDSIAKSSVKSSNSSVASLRSISDSKSNSETQYFDSTKPSSYSNHSVSFNLIAKKAGKSTISYKVGKKSYKTEVIVKNYTNPIKSLKVFGTKTELASKFKSSNVATMKIPSGKLKNTVAVQAASGWKIESVSLRDTGNYTTYEMNSYSSPVSSVTVYTGAVKKGRQYMVYVNLFNTKTNGSQYVRLDLK